MSDLNVLSVSGRIGKDAEKSTTTNGTDVIKFSMAVNGRDKEAAPMWLRITCFGKQGTAIQRYLVKGKQVAVTGRLDVRTWENKEGEKQTSVECIANDIVLLGSKNDEGGGGGGGEVKKAPKQTESFADTDVPF